MIPWKRCFSWGIKDVHSLKMTSPNHKTIWPVSCECVMVPSRHSILLEATPRFGPQRHCLFSSFHVFVTSCPTFHVPAHPFLLVPHFYDLLNISVSLLMLFNAWSVPPSRDELFQLNLQDSRQLRDLVLCSVHFINDSCLRATVTLELIVNIHVDLERYLLSLLFPF